jgi:hypothetical protein
MATLEIDLNCMCLFVRDPHMGEHTGSVHVLMPKTTSEDHQGQHVVRLFHRSFYRNPKGRPMEGWALELGAGGSADTRLAPPSDLSEGGTIVDMTTIAGAKVDRRLLDDKTKVLSRVTFHGGKVLRVGAEKTKWTLKGTDYVMAHQVVWRIDNVADTLNWKHIDSDTKADRPLVSLATLPPDDIVGEVKLYRLSIHHVTADALPPHVSSLSNSAIQSHFREFFKLLDPTPTKDHLPKLSLDNDDLEGAGVFACKETQAAVG